MYSKLVREINNSFLGHGPYGLEYWEGVKSTWYYAVMLLDETSLTEEETRRLLILITNNFNEKYQYLKSEA